MKVVLATAPEEYINKSYAPPLGLGYLAGALLQHGHEVIIVDSHVYEYNIKQAVNAILKHEPTLLGVSASSVNRFSAIRLIREVKSRRPQMIIVAGGPHFSWTAGDALENVPEIDIVVRGEGDRTLPEIVDALQKGAGFEKILGCIFRHDGRIMTNPPRPFIQNLDELPPVPWHLYDLKRYNAVMEGENKTPVVGVISSRGCPNQCVFCANAAKLFRRRDPVKFVDEMEYLHKEYGFKGFDVWDDTLNIVKSHVMEICTEIQRRGLNILWYARLRVNKVDEEMLREMRRSGCISLGYGVESGSPKVLKEIKKDINLDQVRWATQKSLELGFYVRLFFIYSLPGETIDDLKMTEKLRAELQTMGRSDKLYVGAGLCLIYPGTQLETLAKEQGTFREDFSWNTPVRFPESAALGYPKTIPMYRSSNLTTGDIYAITKKMSWEQTITRGFEKLKGLRQPQDLLSFISTSAAYIKGRIIGV